MTDIAVLAVILAVVSLLRERISGWPLTGPMLFVATGMALGPDGAGLKGPTITFLGWFGPRGLASMTHH